MAVIIIIGSFVSPRNDDPFDGWELNDIPECFVKRPDHFFLLYINSVTVPPRPPQQLKQFPKKINCNFFTICFCHSETLEIDVELPTLKS